jgi:hypothetical protein
MGWTQPGTHLGEYARVAGLDALRGSATLFWRLPKTCAFEQWSIGTAWRSQSRRIAAHSDGDWQVQGLAEGRWPERADVTPSMDRRA